MPGSKWSDVPDMEDTFDRRWMAAIEERLLYEEHTRAALARVVRDLSSTPKPLMSLARASRVLGVSVRTLRSWVAVGDMPVVRFRGRGKKRREVVRLEYDAVINWIGQTYSSHPPTVRVMFQNQRKSARGTLRGEAE